MRKILMIFLAYFAFSVAGKAQKDNPADDLQKILAEFPELQSGKVYNTDYLLATLDKNVEPNLTWRVLFEKNQFMKVGEFSAHPIGYYKRNDKVVVVLYANGEKGNAIAHFIDVQTYNLKSGKRISQISNIGAFGGTGSAGCALEISEDKKIVGFATTTLVSTDKIVVEISDKGIIKEPKK